jgi:hypothetical protein
MESTRTNRTHVAASCWTDGLMQTGGTEMYCQRNSSGLPDVGSSPRSSQSTAGTFLKSVKTRNGLRSSTALSRCVSRSFDSNEASVKLSLNATCPPTPLSPAAFAGTLVLFLPRNCSWAIRIGPIFLTTPLMAPQ